MTKECVFEIGENGKIKCIEHNQSLLYVYHLKNQIHMYCQVGEEERQKKALLSGKEVKVNE